MSAMLEHLDLLMRCECSDSIARWRMTMWAKLERRFSKRALAEVCALIERRMDWENGSSLEELGVDNDDEYQDELMEDAYYSLRELDRDEIVSLVLGDEPFEDFLARIAAGEDGTYEERRLFDRACDGPDPDPWGEYGPGTPYFAWLCQAPDYQIPEPFKAGPETFPKSLDEVCDPVLADLLMSKAGYHITALRDGWFLADPERFFSDWTAI